MDTWREKIADSLSNFFDQLGIHPIVGIAIIITPLVIMRLRKIGEFKSQKNWEKMYDIAFYIGAGSIYVALIFVLLGVF